MKIGLDFDGVIANTAKMKVEMALGMFGVTLAPERCKAELAVDVLTVQEYRDLTLAVSTNELGLLVEPMEGALESIRLLQREGHNLSVVTSRDGELLVNAVAWSVKHALELPFRGVGHEKSKAFALAGYDVFLDDDLEKLADLAEVVPHRFLFSHGYNAHHDVPAGIIRVGSWCEFVEHIRRSSSSSKFFTAAC